MPTLTDVGRRAQALGLAAVLTACSSAPPAPPARTTCTSSHQRAIATASRADTIFRSGDVELGVELATRALVMRIAQFGPEHFEPAFSFAQLARMRLARKEIGWAARSYLRALELTAKVPACRGFQRGVATELAELLERNDATKAAARIRAKYGGQP